MTRELPILFNGEMVRAILRGAKVETRRPVKPRDETSRDWFDTIKYRTAYHEGGGAGDGSVLRGHIEALIQDYSPLGSPGDLLYVRETWAPTGINVIGEEVRYSGSVAALDVDSVHRIVYAADSSGESMDADGPWRPSIHMPKRAARIWLRVVEVRVERVQEITEPGARDEGIACVPGGYKWGLPGDQKYNAPTHAFRALWDSIYTAQGLGWDLNPWVWVCRFEVVSTTGRPTS